MIVNTPDGQVQFPDDMSNDDIKGVLQKKYGAPQATSAPSTSSTSQGWQSANEGVLPALRDYGLAGIDDLTLGAAKAHLPANVGQMIAQAHSNLGPMDPIMSATTYGLGPGKILGPVGRALGGSGVLGTMAEGALAGGTHGAVATQDPSLSGIAEEAGQGAGLGFAAGSVGSLLRKLLSSPGTVNPQAAEAVTKQASKDIYTSGKNIPVNPIQTGDAISKVMRGLDPSEETGLSPGMRSRVNDISDAIRLQGNMAKTLDANQVDSWQRQLKNAATNEIDGGVAKSLSSALDDVLVAHNAGQWSQDAKEAFKQSKMAENLAEWQRKTAAGAPVGQAPLTEAETYYRDPSESDKYKILSDLYKRSQGPSLPSWALGHLTANALGAAGGTIAGFPGAFAGEALGYLGAKPLINRAMKGFDKNQMLKAYQRAYPPMTGVSPTGGRQVPAGDLVKNLMLGTAY